MTEISTARIIADSVSPAGHRFVTFECVYPRIVLAEINTHRLLSRVSASSRAVPVEKMIKRVLEDPYVPTHWGKNQKGMRAEEDVDAETAQKAVAVWLKIRDQVVLGVRELLELGIHKQITNRWLETAQWHPTVISGTEFSNFFNLRDHKAAHPDFRDLAHAMRELYEKSERLDYDEWHQPYIGPEDYDAAWRSSSAADSQELSAFMCKVSVGRCARVSSLTHEGTHDLQADVDLHDKMMVGGHCSPYENGVVTVPLTRGYVAVIDDADRELVSKFNWFASGCDGQVYAVRHQRIGGGQQLTIYMHRYIVGADVGDNLEVDHRDRNRLNNRRKNHAYPVRSQLTICTPRGRGVACRSPSKSALSPSRGLAQRGPLFAHSLWLSALRCSPQLSTVRRRPTCSG